MRVRLILRCTTCVLPEAIGLKMKERISLRISSSKTASAKTSSYQTWYVRKSIYEFQVQKARGKSNLTILLFLKNLRLLLQIKTTYAIPRSCTKLMIQLSWSNGQKFLRMLVFSLSLLPNKILPSCCILLSINARPCLLLYTDWTPRLVTILVNPFSKPFVRIWIREKCLGSKDTYKWGTRK